VAERGIAAAGVLTLSKERTQETCISYRFHS
jgi:hypothetical protein